MPDDGISKSKDEKEGDKDKIVMEARMHCEDCKYKVYRSIIGYPGIEEIGIDMKAQRVSLKGKVDAKQLFEKVRKRSENRVTKLIHFPQDKKPDDKKQDQKPKDVVVVLKVSVDCKACRKKVEKAMWDIKDVQSVKVEADRVTVVGKDLDPKEVCEHVGRRSGKHVEIVAPKKDGGKKKEGGGSGDGEGEGEGEGKGHAKNYEMKWSKAAVMEHVHPPQYFSEENPHACALM